MRWLTPSIVAAVLGLAACRERPREDVGTTAALSASATPSAASAIPSAAVPATSSTEGEAAPAPRPPAPPFKASQVPTIAPASPPGCVLETIAPLAQSGGLPLRVDPASTPFLRVTTGGARLTWPPGPGAPVATVVREALTIQGFAPENITVRPSTVFTLGGVLRATAGSVFTLVGNGPGRVVPSVVSPLFRFYAPLAARSCRDFALDTPKLDAKAGLPVPKIVKKAYLRAGAVAVAATQTSVPVLELSPALAGSPVTVLEEGGGRVRFVLEREEGIVIAWATAGDVRDNPEAPPEPGLGGLGLIGHGGGSGFGDSSRTMYECSEDVPLYVDMADASTDDLHRRPYARVGTLQKNNRFSVHSGKNGLDPLVGQRLEGLVFTGQGSLSVDLGGAQTCRRVRRERSR